MTDFNPLWNWMREREAVRIRRDEGLPRPWSADPIFNENKFCNVRREDDRVTVWVKRNIRDHHSDHPLLWFMLCIARQINWPPTLMELMVRMETWPYANSDAFSPEAMTELLLDRQRRGEKVFTGAYLVGGGNSGLDGSEPLRKAKYMCEVVLGPLWKDRERLSLMFSDPKLTIEHAHGVLTTYHGWGQFLAYQVLVDMRFTRILSSAPDRLSWAAAGPGTLRGLNRVHGRPVKRPRPSQEQALKEIREIFALAETEVPEIPIDFSDVPNILCETDKYLRVQSGEGQMRSKFTPTTEPEF